jgi:hypothetical protein
VPTALLSGIGIVTLVYLSINIAYFVVLDVETMKSSNAVAAVSISQFTQFINSSFLVVQQENVG